MQSDIKKTESEKTNDTTEALALVGGLILGTVFGLLILKLMGGI